MASMAWIDWPTTSSLCCAINEPVAANANVILRAMAELCRQNGHFLRVGNEVQCVMVNIARPRGNASTGTIIRHFVPSQLPRFAAGRRDDRSFIFGLLGAWPHFFDDRVA